MKKKLTALALVVVLLAVAVVGGSLAYFTDTDEATNTFTMGNIAIEQTEWQRNENGVVEAFDQDKLIMPAVGDPAWGGVFNYGTTDTGLEIPGGNDLWAKHMNAQDKFVVVENTGSEPLYYRTIIAVENPEGGAESRLNVNGNERFDWDPTTTGVQNGNKAKVYNVGGYAVMVGTYVPVLESGEVSRPSFLQLAYDKSATQEEMEKFGEEITILAFTQAVQSQGFTDVYTADVACNALNDSFDVITEANLAAWIAEVVA